MTIDNYITIITIIFSVGVVYGALSVRLKNISKEIELSEANIKLYIQDKIKKENEKINVRIDEIDHELQELKLEGLHGKAS